MGFVYVADGIDDVLAAHLNQYADAWTGVSGKGVPFNAVAVNDPINFAISARNLDPTNSRVAQFLKADGTVLLQCDASGVKISPDGTVASVPVTAAATQTLTNKSLTSPTISGTVAGGAIYTAPHFTSPVVDSGNLALTTGQAITNSLAAFRAKDLGSIANAAAVAVDDVAASLGILFVIYGGGAVAAYALNGGVHTTTLLFGPAATFTTTFNNAGTVNVYWNTSDYFLQNNTGGANAFRTFLFSNG